MESVREQGRMVAESLRPLLEQQEISSLPLLNDEVARFATKQTGVKVLFRPAGEFGAESFYFVASQPPIAPTELAAERDRLVERGVFDNLAPGRSAERRGGNGCDSTCRSRGSPYH